MSQDERAAEDRDREAERVDAERVDERVDASHDAEILSSLGPGLNQNLLGATLRSADSVEDLGRDRRHDRLAAGLSIGIFVVLGVALALFLALR